MSNRVKNILLVFLLVCVIVIAVFFRVYFLENPPKDNVTNPQVTENNVTYVPVTVAPTAVVKNTPMPTIVPAATPEVWYFSTVTPNTNVVATNKPTVLPTDVIINTPTPTVNVTPTPTMVPTQTPNVTPVPTLAPTATPTPTQTVVVSTATPVVYSEEALKQVIVELNKVTGGINEILPSYDGQKKYDLYNYISIENVDPSELFEVLKSIYIDTLAHSLDFKFEYGSTPDGVKQTLDTAYCDSCGKLKCVYKKGNTSEMLNLLGRVNFGNVQEVNAILMNFLYENTIVEDNISERLIVCCSCDK